MFMEKRKKKDKIKDFGKIAIYSTILLIIFLLFDNSSINISENLKIVTGVVFLILALVWLFSSFAFFISIIIHQFKNEKIFWGIVNILLGVLVLINSYNDWGLIILAPLILSTASYYFIYVNPIKKKK